MPVIVAGIALAIVISLGVGYLLYASEKPVYQAMSATPSVRIDEPGTNLVGPDWSGLYKTPSQAGREKTARGEE